MIAVIDNGHGRETPGKRSPVWGDGTQLFEWEFNRDVARRIVAGMHGAGKKCVLLVAEDSDVPLPERVRRANTMHRSAPGGAVLVSIHANAGGGHGWEAFTSVGQTKSDTYATILYKQAGKAFPNARLRIDTTDGDPDKEADFYLLKNTICPAVLTENFFMDTESDCRILLSSEERQKIADFHVAALIEMGCE